MSRILIVEDSIDLLAMAATLLRIDGHEVAIANNDDQFRIQLLKFKPEIILMDVMLRGSDGRDLCKEIKENSSRSGIRMILMSASPEILMCYRSCGADAIINKPFQRADLIQVIDQQSSMIC